MARRCRLARSDAPALPDMLDQRRLLDRILATPQLARVVSQLHPQLLHGVIQRWGLEDCGELLALVMDHAEKMLCQGLIGL